MGRRFSHLLGLLVHYLGSSSGDSAARDPARELLYVLDDLAERTSEEQKRETQWLRAAQTWCGSVDADFVAKLRAARNTAGALGGEISTCVKREARLKKKHAKMQGKR